MIIDNKEIINCKQCNTKEITFNMYIFNNLLYCFKCSMEKLKYNIKRYWLTKNNNLRFNYITK